ncbi:IS66 family transposase [Sporosarcina limicola]|uniref:Transposase n=1 Tax=Sporosarcina limicola TaxID=34101 RepID=A0A927MK04_9BACL|nr:IS66 family transposase [Sporosarcina limicola]MBE1556013.1 transposase [Sporosarcina limicola]
MQYSAKDIEKISHGKPADIATFITTLLTHIEKLETRVNVLERQVGLTSANSSKPPSSDGLRKPKSMRKSGGKKGAPKNHDGYTLNMVDEPDVIEWHPVQSCSHCATSLEDIPADGYVRRQVFDLPLPKIVVTEHRFEKKCCPNCTSKQQAPFPENVKAPVQYGDSWAAWCAYLHTFQLLPLERISQFFQDMTGYRPSEATLLNRLDAFHEELEPIEKHIQQEIIKSDVLHSDETGLRIEDKTQWLHVVSSEDWTLYHAHEKRGQDAINEHGILSKYEGILVHDFWAPYFTTDYSYEHAMCGAHLLRECQGIMDHDKHRWAADMQKFLQETWSETKKARKSGILVDEFKMAEWEAEYDAILSLGEIEWFTAPVPDAPLKRGRKKKSKAANLGERFQNHKTAILRFIRDDRVPFDNSLAERDVRRMKVKQKVSGSFRTVKGAERFARIRGFVSTVRKQNRGVLSSLIAVQCGKFTF